MATTTAKSKKAPVKSPVRTGKAGGPTLSRRHKVFFGLIIVAAIAAGALGYGLWQNHQASASGGWTYLGSKKFISDGGSSVVAVYACKSPIARTTKSYVKAKAIILTATGSMYGGKAQVFAPEVQSSVQKATPLRVLYTRYGGPFSNSQRGPFGASAWLSKYSYPSAGLTDFSYTSPSALARC